MYFRIRSIIPIIIIGFALDAAQAQVPAQDDLQKTTTITGHVTINGRGASGVVVHLTPAMQIGNYRSITTKTDQSGYFRFANICCSFSAAMSVEILPETSSLINGNRPLEWGIPVKVSPGAIITGIDFALTRGAVITGRVLDERGRPVDDEWVTCLLFDPDGSTWREKGTPVQTNSLGQFRFSGLPTGSYRLVVRRAYTNGYATTYYPNAMDVTKAYTLEIKAGTEVRNRDIRLSLRPTFAVSGRVIDGHTNQPMPNIPWGFHPIPSQYPPSTYRNDFVGYSGPHGAIHLSGLLPGKYVAYIGNQEGGRDFYCDPAEFEISEKNVTDINIKAYRGASISGR